MSRILTLILLSVFSIGCTDTASLDPNVDSVGIANGAKDPSRDTKTRTFRFVYGAVLTDLNPGSTVRVWIPVAKSNHDQDVELQSIQLPSEYQRTQDKKHGNPLIYFEATADGKGEVPMEVTYLVTRRELTQSNYESATDDGTTFLQASSLVPTGDNIRMQVLGDAIPKGDQIVVARQLYDGVDNLMDYDKPAEKPGWGNGDAVWACNNGFGNCTDFHSLFISSARNLKIPARFEIGFPIPTDIGKGEVGGYHCWAKFLVDKKWVPVDISEADKNPKLKEYYFGNLTPDRVLFSIGRDLELQPPTAAEFVNYLSYPYAEVDGVQHKSFRKAFRYEDVKDHSTAGGNATNINKSSGNSSVKTPYAD